MKPVSPSVVVRTEMLVLWTQKRRIFLFISVKATYFDCLSHGEKEILYGKKAGKSWSVLCDRILDGFKKTKQRKSVRIVVKYLSCLMPDLSWQKDLLDEGHFERDIIDARILYRCYQERGYENRNNEFVRAISIYNKECVESPSVRRPMFATQSSLSTDC